MANDTTVGAYDLIAGSISTPATGDGKLLAPSGDREDSFLPDIAGWAIGLIAVVGVMFVLSVIAIVVPFAVTYRKEVKEGETQRRKTDVEKEARASDEERDRSTGGSRSHRQSPSGSDRDAEPSQLPTRAGGPKSGRSVAVAASIETADLEPVDETAKPPISSDRKGVSALPKASGLKKSADQKPSISKLAMQ